MNNSASQSNDDASKETLEKPASDNSSEAPIESPIVVVDKCDPITQRFKRVKTRRIRRNEFYSADGKLIDEDSQD